MIQFKLPLQFIPYDILYQYRDIIDIHIDPANRVINFPLPIDDNIIDIVRMLIGFQRTGKIYTIGDMDPFRLGELDGSHINYFSLGYAMHNILSYSDPDLSYDVSVRPLLHSDIHRMNLGELDTKSVTELDLAYSPLRSVCSRLSLNVSA